MFFQVAQLLILSFILICPAAHAEPDASQVHLLKFETGNQTTFAFLPENERELDLAIKAIEEYIKPETEVPITVLSPSRTQETLIRPLNRVAKQSLEKGQYGLSGFGHELKVASEVSQDVVELQDLALKWSKLAHLSAVYHVQSASGIEPVEPQNEGGLNLVTDESQSSQGFKKYFSDRRNLVLTMTIGTVSGVVTAIGLSQGMATPAVVVGSVINGSIFAGYQLFIEPYSKWLGDDGWFKFKNAPVERASMLKQMLKRGSLIVTTVLAYQLGLASVGAVSFDASLVKTLLTTSGYTLLTGQPWGAVFGNLGSNKGRPLPAFLQKYMSPTNLNVVLSAVYALATTLSVSGQTVGATVTYGALTATGLVMWGWQSLPFERLRGLMPRVFRMKGKCESYEKMTDIANLSKEVKVP